MNYYNEIKNKLMDNIIYEKVKDYFKERNRIITYYEIGKLLDEAGGKYGDRIIDEYSKKLVIEVGKNYNRRTLYRMKQLYNIFSYEKVSTLSTQLTWSHYVELLPLKDANKINYYINLITSSNLSIRQLRERIKLNEYERLPKEEYINNSSIHEISKQLKYPIFIKNTGGYDKITEKVLQKLILEDIDRFLKELGEGFCYIKNEYPIKLGNNYIDKEVKSIYHDKTIGIIIVKKDNCFIMEYCSDERILRTTYKIM